MGRTKQTPRGSASHQPVGMMAATFTSKGRGKAGPEGQFIDAPEEDTEEDFPLVLEDAEKQPGQPGASKSKGKKLAQATEGAEAPPEETPLDTEPHTDPAPTEPQPGTSKAPVEDPTQAPTDETTQPAARNPDEDEPPAPSRQRLVRFCSKRRGTSVHQVVYKLLELGCPYIDNFDQMGGNKYSSVSGTKQAGS